MSQPPKFFITHSWKDVAFAKRLSDDLRVSGLEGFFDMYSIQPGDDLVERINRGLEECDVYVPILSFAALESPWCKEEINAAISLSNQPLRQGRPRIIPVLIENCMAAMPPLLQTRLYIRFGVSYLSPLRELLKQGFGIDPSTLIHEASMSNGPRLQSGIEMGDQIWWGACVVLEFSEADRGKLLRIRVEPVGSSGRMPWIELWRGAFDGKDVAAWLGNRVHVTRTSQEQKSPLKWTIETGIYSVYFVDYMCLTQRMDHPDLNDPYYAYGKPFPIPMYRVLYRVEIL